GIGTIEQQLTVWRVLSWERSGMAFWRSKSEPKAADSPETTAPAVGSASGGVSGPAEGGSLLARMRAGLEKTRAVLNTDVRDLFKSEGRLVDDTLLEELFA